MDCNSSLLGCGYYNRRITPNPEPTHHEVITKLKNVLVLLVRKTLSPQIIHKIRKNVLNINYSKDQT